MAKRLSNITDHINTEQEKISNYINRNLNKIKNIEDIIQEQQYLNQINFHIDLLANHLSDIIETILLAKLNIIPKNILNPIELNEIFQIINNKSIDIISEEHIYEILKLQAYYNSSNIILNVQIPVFSSEKYNMYHLITLPINKTKELDIKEYIMYNEHRIQYLTEICPRIENTFICEGSPHQESAKQSQCVGKLMKGEDANCPMNDIESRSAIIQPENNSNLLINIPKTLIETNCRNSITIEGTALIQFRDCTIEINGVIYNNKPDEFLDQIFLLQLPTPNIRSNVTKDILSLQKLKKDYLHYEQILVKEQTTNYNNQVFTYSALTVLSIVGTIAFLVIRKRKMINYIIRDTGIAPTTSQSLWPSLNSKGGGVTSPHTMTSYALATSAPTTTNCIGQ